MIKTLQEKQHIQGAVTPEKSQVFQVVSVFFSIYYIVRKNGLETNSTTPTFDPKQVGFLVHKRPKSAKFHGVFLGASGDNWSVERGSI